MVGERRLYAVLEHILAQQQPADYALQVGRQLMRTILLCGLLPGGVTEQLPLEWLEDLSAGALPGCKRVVAETLVARLDKCADEQLLERMPRFWQFDVWAEVDVAICKRAVHLLTRWSGLAGQGPEEVGFACNCLLLKNSLLLL